MQFSDTGVSDLILYSESKSLHCCFTGAKTCSQLDLRVCIRRKCSQVIFSQGTEEKEKGQIKKSFSATELWHRAGGIGISANASLLNSEQGNCHHGAIPGGIWMSATGLHCCSSMGKLANLTWLNFNFLFPQQDSKQIIFSSLKA